MKRTITLLMAAIAATAMLVLSCKKNEQPAPPVLEEIILDQEELSLPEGEEATLGVTLVPAEMKNVALVWESKNEDVATVDQKGKVSAVKGGTTKIVVTATDFGVHAQCRVTVEERSIALDKTTASMIIGEELTLKATIKPSDVTDKEITWTSDKPEIAKVAEGKVTALSEGTAVITAESGGKKATCTITVKLKDITKFAIICPEGGEQLDLGATTQLSVKIEPADATDKAITWTSDKPEIATVDKNGLVKAVKQGRATIKASLQHGDTALEDQVEIEVEGDLKITNYPNLTGISWGCKRIFTAGNKSDDAAREVTWSIEFPGTKDPENCGTTINPTTGEVNCLPKKVNGENVYENYEVRIIATAKDNGSTAEKKFTCMYWKAVVTTDVYGTVAPADHIFRRGDDIHIIYKALGGTLHNDIVKNEMTIEYNSAKLYHYSNELWKLMVKDDAPEGPETVTVKIGDYSQSFIINIESTTAPFSIKPNVKAAYWGETIKFTAENGTVKEWIIEKPTPELNVLTRTHLSVIDKQNGTLKVGEYADILWKNQNDIRQTNVFENKAWTVTATSVTGKKAEASITALYWKVQLSVEETVDGETVNVIVDPAKYEFCTGDIITVEIVAAQEISPIKLEQWSITTTGEGLRKTNTGKYPAVFELLEGGSEGDYTITAKLGGVKQKTELVKITL